MANQRERVRDRHHKRPATLHPLPGDHSAVEPPDPIPNSEVKRSRADGSVHPHARVGHRQGLTPNPRRVSLRGFFFAPPEPGPRCGAMAEMRGDDVIPPLWMAGRGIPSPCRRRASWLAARKPMAGAWGLPSGGHPGIPRRPATAMSTRLAPPPPYGNRRAFRGAQRRRPTTGSRLQPLAVRSSARSVTTSTSRCASRDGSSGITGVTPWNTRWSSTRAASKAVNRCWCGTDGLTPTGRRNSGDGAAVRRPLAPHPRR